MMAHPIQGAIDPAAAGANQRDGRCLLDEYRELGLDLAPAANAVEAGIHRCLRLMQTARLKVFRTCTQWLKEKRLYRRDEKGKIVKEKDHAMDAMRYVIFTDGIYEAAPEPEDAREERWGEF